MKVYIAGASGYLGSHLVKSLSSQFDVFALTRKSSHLDRILDYKCEVIPVDETGALEKAFRCSKPDVVINAAALYGRKGETVREVFNANVNFPLLLLEYCNAFNVSAFINVGTSLPREVGLYALTKNILVEQAKYQYFEETKFINLQLEHFFGAGDDPSKFSSYVFNQCLYNNVIEMTHGTQERDFIYISDVVSAIEVIISRLDDIDPFANVGVGLGIAPSVKRFVETVKLLSNSSSEIKFGVYPTRENEPMNCCADLRLLNTLGWQPKFTLEEGILEVLGIEKARANI